ncbi:MAG TPA: tetratricopeptide repeat protein [Chromatiales bacterium]|jgi:regulator of sirC expression with transglutaminase-like and TPR domain|nr:tetratricopeptide repeat protein [Chromatiaceae bacterium]HIB83482.1 tetratricopeptide repeat protein [Chromatiaceae bacterium]HIN81470.1 tetratricopeptide repeat protein [Chromatiales bacterium]HIO14869.1 tetratricopeptide repeat protein [Chromatiales bacterium]HIO54190.1 tetratricopeptide repeat protein [Chromatiales bacterium]
MESAEERFARLMKLPDASIDLPRAALLIAQTEYPELDINRYLNQIDHHTNEVRDRLFGNHTAEAVIEEINNYLFEEQSFSGNVDDYYDPRNTFFSDLLDRHLGAPISLSLLYMEIGQRLGLPLEGVSFPGHFLVKFDTGHSEIILDPFLKGASLSNEDLEQRLEELYEEESERPDLESLLAPSHKRDILVRMLRNLKAIYFQKENYEKALSISKLIFQVNPKLPVEMRDRGTIFLRMECMRGAMTDYRSYLDYCPDASDGDEIRHHLISLERHVSLLN